MGKETTFEKVGQGAFRRKRNVKTHSDLCSCNDWVVHQPLSPFPVFLVQASVTAQEGALGSSP